VAIIHKNNLAKFGYILDKKSRKKMLKNACIFLVIPTTTYHKNYEELDLCKRNTEIFKIDHMIRKHVLLLTTCGLFVKNLP